MSKADNKAVAAPSVNLVALSKAQEDANPGAPPPPAFAVALDGVPLGTQVELVFWEVIGDDDDQECDDRELGRLYGTTSALRVPKGWCSFDPDQPLPSKEDATGTLAKGEPRPVLVSFQVFTPAGEQKAYFRLEDADAHVKEGDAWEIQASAVVWIEGERDEFFSPIVRVSRLRRRISADKASHPPRAGNRIKFYNDGFDDRSYATGAFVDMLDAIKNAKHFIFAADWSFHPLFRPGRAGSLASASLDGSIGKILLAKAKDGVTIGVHTWDHTSGAAPDDQNDAGDAVMELLAGGKLPKNFLWRKSSRSGPIGYLADSHHQKMLVMDYPEADGRLGIRAFLGGLDLTKGRVDCGEHPVAPTPHDGLGNSTTWAYAQKWSAGKWPVDEWYNTETEGNRNLPRQPWHDIHARLEGPSAWDYLREFVGRWLAADEANLETMHFWNLLATPAMAGPISGVLWSSIDDRLRADNPILGVYLSLFDRTRVYRMDEAVPDAKWCVQVCRSLEKDHWNAPIPATELTKLPKNNYWSKACGFDWRLPGAREQSILEAYYNGIKQADNFIYIENQYFIGSGADWGYKAAQNDVPGRIVDKIQERRKAGLDFHVYIVMPMFPEGVPSDASMQELRACEAATIESMIRTLGDDWERYLSFYFLANWDAVDPSLWFLPTEAVTDKTWARREMMAAHQRYMIYVHSKLMIVDDRYVILGSCNINDRGLVGDSDSEIVSSIWPMLKHQDACVQQIQKLRHNLWKEHFGEANVPAAWQTPEKQECWKQVKTNAYQNYKAFRELTKSPKDGHLCLLNFRLGPERIEVKRYDTDLGVGKITGPDSNQCLPDSPVLSDIKAEKQGWLWRGRFKTFMPRFLVK